METTYKHEDDLKEIRNRIVEKYCGNCRFHAVYKYPEKIFCNLHLKVSPTLECCEDWELNPQECFCVREAKKSALKL